MVSIFASFVVLLDLGFSALAGEDFFTISKKKKKSSSRYQKGNYQPSSCFCRIIAACCSFVR